MNPMVIAVDFDGTIVNHEYPEIGTGKSEAWNTLIAMRRAGHSLVLWTCRENDEHRNYLDEAVEHCRRNGVVFDAVNSTPEWGEFRSGGGRKVVADVYIDDRNIGGFLGWRRYAELLGLERT